MDPRIRRYKSSDAAAFQEAVLSSINHLSRWLSWCTPAYSINDAVEWVNSAENSWKAGTDYRFLVEDTKTGAVIGGVGINQIVHQHPVGNLGYWVRESAINRGVCTTAARLATEYAFRELGFQRIEIHIQVDNHASNAVASKLGGEFEGILRNKLMFNGESVRAKCYSIIPSDYE